MKFAAATALLFATLALANPKPVETRDQLGEALAAREAEPAPGLAPEIEARAAGIRLDTRGPKKSKPKTGSSSSGNDTDTDSAAGIISANRALELGALGLGVVALWI